jgi:hypothetical protein
MLFSPNQFCFDLKRMVALSTLSANIPFASMLQVFLQLGIPTPEFRYA